MTQNTHEHSLRAVIAAAIVLCSLVILTGLLVQQPPTPEPAPTSTQTSSAPLAAQLTTPVPTVQTCPAIDEKWIPDPPVARVHIGKGSPSRFDLAPDGQSLTVGTGGGVILYQSGTFEELWFTPTASAVYDVRYSVDGKQVVGALADGTVEVWDAAIGEETQTFKVSDVPVKAVSFSPDGQIVATGDQAGRIALWDVATGKLLRVLQDCGAPVRDLAFNPIKMLLATTDSDQADVKVWDAVSGTLRNSYPRTGVQVAWSTDGTRLAASANGHAAIWDADTGEKINIWLSEYEMGGVAFVPGNDAVITGGMGNLIRWGDPSGDTPFASWASEVPWWIRQVKMSPDGHDAYAMGFGGNILGFDVSSKQNRVLKTVGVSGVSWMPDGKTVVLQTDGDAWLWDLQTGQQLKSLPVYDIQDNRSGLILSPDAKLAADEIAERHAISLRDTADGRELRTFPFNADRVYDMAFSADSTLLAAVIVHLADPLGGVKDSRLIVWNVQTGQQIYTYGGPPHRFYNLNLSPDRGRIALDDYVNKSVIHIMRFSTGEMLKEIEGSGSVFAWAPDGIRIAFGGPGANYTVTIYDSVKGLSLLDIPMPKRTNAPGTDYPYSLSFNLDGTILTARLTERVQSWNTSTGQTTALPIDQQDLLAQSPDGKWHLTRDSFGLIGVWQTMPRRGLLDRRHERKASFMLRWMDLPLTG